MNSINSILANPQPFLDNLFKDLKDTQIDVEKFELDHICYRVETLERYNELKKLMLEISSLLSETLISDRPISTFKLFEPISYLDRDIWLIEIPAPKEGAFYIEGFEHAEFVIDQQIEHFMTLYPNIEFNTKSITKPLNPEVGVKMEKSNVKFHELSLEMVCEIEDQQ